VLKYCIFRIHPG